MTSLRDGNLERTKTIVVIVTAIVAAITGFITWSNGIFSTPPQPDPLFERREVMYAETSELVAKILAAPKDSLPKYFPEFEQLYGQLIYVEDSNVCLSMKRFRYEFDAKLNGLENIAMPNKFRLEGLGVINACRVHMTGERHQ